MSENDDKAILKPLSPNQIAFCNEYLKTGNATKSYLAVGYKAKSEETAAALASRLLRNDNIQAYINSIKQKAAKHISMTLADIIREMEKIAGTDLNEAMELDEDGHVKIKAGIDLNQLDGVSISTSHSVGKDGYSRSNSFSYKKSDKLKALVELAKMKGAYDNDDEGGTGRNLQRSNRRFLQALGRVKPRSGDGEGSGKAQ